MYDKKELIFRLTIFISKMTLRVRFPCTVCCAIKTDGNERDISGEGELNNGQAILNLNYVTEIHLPSKKDFSLLQKKCMLLIYLKSSGGRIPAGSVSLPLMRAQSRSMKQMSRIDKCPDKNAFVEFQMKLEKLEEKKDTTLTTAFNKESRSFKNQHSHRNIKNIKLQSPEKIHEDKNQSKFFRNSKAESAILRRMPSKREQIRSSLIQTYYSGQRKIDDGEKIFALEREIDSFKTKVMILENEVNSKNQKVSESEKEMKQLQKKNEQLDLELRSSVSKIQYAERGNKQSTNQIKQLKERAQQDKLNYQNSIKRLQIRQNSFKQQIKVLSQKLYTNQNQKQRMVYQKNLSSNEFEGREKKIRECFKEKEKKLIQERNSMLKKIDSLEKDLQKVKQQINEAKSKNIENIQQVHELKLNIETIQSQKQRFRSECNDLRFELTKLKNQKYILEENLDSIGKFTEERRNFRKQLNDKDIENSQYKDKIASLQGQLTRLRSANQDLDKNLREKSNNFKVLQRDYNILMKENEILMNDISDKQTKIVNLMDELQLEMKQTKFFEGKNVDLQQEFQSKQDALQRELRQSSSYRTALQQQIQKLNQELQSSSRQLAQSMNEIHQLQQILQEKSEQISNLESQLIKLNSINQQWQMEKIELQQDKRQLQEKYNQVIEESQERENDLNAKVFSMSQKWELSASQLQKSLNQAYEKIKMLNNTIRERDQHISSLRSANNKFEEQLETLFKQKQTLISQMTNLKNENNRLKTSITHTQKQVSDRDAIIQSLRNKIQQIEKQNDTLNEKCQFVNSDLSSYQSFNKKINDELSRFKQASYEILDMIYSNLQSVDLTTHTKHPDQTCNSKTNQILRQISDRNNEINKKIQEKQHQITQLSLQLEDLLEQKQLKQKGLLQAGQNLQILKRSKAQISFQITTKNVTIKELTESIKDKQKQMEQLQAITNKKILGLNSTISQKNRQYAQLKHKHEQLQVSFQKLQVQLKTTNLELKKIEKQKRTIENEHKTKITIADSNLRTQMQRVNTLQADKSSLEKELRQQRENLRKVMRELQSKCYQFQDLQMRLQEHDTIGNFKESQLRKLRQNNAELKYLLDIICSFEATTDKQSQFILKFEKYLSEPSSRDNQTIKQKSAIFFQTLTNFTNTHIDIQQKLRSTISHIESTSKQLSIRNKTTSQLQLKFQELSQTREKQNQSKMAILKSFQQQKNSTDALKRLVQEVLQLLGTLQKEKKASVFVISPVKQLVKKLEDKIVFMLKGFNLTMNKNKREWDLANLRAKKNASKREQVVSPPLRP